MKTKEELLNEISENPHFKTYEHLGQFSFAQGNLNDAILYFSAAAGLGNKQSKPRYLLGQCLIQIGRFYDAAVKLREALDMNPNYRSAAELLNQILADHPEIVEDLEIQPVNEESK